MDCAVDSTPAEQRCIRGVNDRVNAQCRDVDAFDANALPGAAGDHCVSLTVLAAVGVDGILCVHHRLVDRLLGAFDFTIAFANSCRAEDRAGLCQ